MATLETINARIQKLRMQAEALAQRDRSGAIAKVLKLMAQLGVSVSDLPSGGAAAKGRRKGAAGKKTVGVAKYRDPASGKTWTGHGRAPDWIKNARNRDEFLIGGASAAASEAQSATPKKRGRKASAKGANGVAGARRTTTGRARGAAAKPAAKTPKPRKAAGAKRAGRATSAAAKAPEEPGTDAG